MWNVLGILCISLGSGYFICKGSASFFCARVLRVKYFAKILFEGSSFQREGCVTVFSSCGISASPL